MKRNCWSNVRDIDENPYCDVPFLLLVYAEHPEFAILNASMVKYLLDAHMLTR